MRVFALAARLAGAMPALALGGCLAGPDYLGPPVGTVPARWEPAPADVTSRTVPGSVEVDWWKSFHDRELSSLVDRLAAQNLDLKSAAERVIQGVAQRQIAYSQGLPHVGGQAQDTYNRQSLNGTLSLLTPAPGAPATYGLFQDSLNSSWELDFFGRIRRAVEAADAATLAAIENRHAVALASLAELAQTYMQLRGTQVRLEIAARNLELAKENVDLVQARFGNGVATTLDLAQARAQQATIAATLPPLRTEEAALINAEGYLLGETPHALDGELHGSGLMPHIPRRIPIGLPATLIRRRPDVREAEARLHEATAQTGVAVANFYPDVTLNGNLNVESLHLANLFTPNSIAYTLGPSVSLPIFEGGQLHGNLVLRESEQREAAIAFQRTVLQAWREVDDALTAFSEAQHRRAELAKAVDQNKIALDAARQRYTQGAVDFLNVIAAQTQLLQSENDLADSDTQIAVDLVTLYRALGGGWEIADTAVAIGPPPPPPAGVPPLPPE
ncbi:MAG TPA: efflux transporter outer membrane subunit [Methylovirgula sp.]|nr:efflux transporter outer membrane subunit [Methylovirgula sp.]